MSLQDLQNADEFLEQMFCGLQSGGSWSADISSGAVGVGGGHNKVSFPWDVDQSNFLATKLQQHQISVGTGDVGIFGNEVVNASSFKSPSGDNPIQALFNGFSGSQQSNQTPEFQFPQAQSIGSPGNASGLMNQGATTNRATGSGSGGVGGASGPPAQPRQRVRARRGQATDPHSIAERLRRERIAERMKSLQELVPNANKTDKASMLDEIIDYVKFLQLQVKVLSMSRLGGAGAGAVAPPVADISSEGGRDTVQVGAGASSSNDTMTVAENQVVKLMEEDMGSAMQYLQGKGLCLMPISLATAISSATCHPSSARNNHPFLGGGPSSPNISGLTVQSAANRVLPQEGISVKDSTSVSKP